MKLEALMAIAIAAAGLGCVEEGDVVQPPLRWELVWYDEFDGAAGTPPRPDYWAFDVGGHGWGNEQLEYDTDRVDNAAHDGDGHLVITAREEPFAGNAYTSARIKSEARFEQRYGLFEARLRLPSGRGLWPAFWMLGADIGEVGWPQCGEIDIMEYRGQEPSVVLGSLHGPGYSGGSALTTTYRLGDDARFDDEFHVFAIEWDPGRISWSVDGNVYQIATTAEVIGRGDWVFDHPFFLLLNLAVGGRFVGNPDETTSFPQSMYVDYVRVYQRAD
jgi:beta-glucanase (GH16 family)